MLEGTRDALTEVLPSKTGLQKPKTGENENMDIFDILSLICGLALFLYGMEVMGDALKKSAGRRLKVILGNLTSNKFKGFLLGLAVTAVIQSSSATTVMVVGFVNSGTMLLSQAIGVIMGANVGTAVTSWLTAMSGIGADGNVSSVLMWLKPDAWMPVLALVGICFIMFAKKGKKKDVGSILIGFAVLMTGMSIMSGAVSGLKESTAFSSILVMFNNPLFGVLAGALLTAIVQSSSASIGILQSLTTTGTISFGMAIPIILGQNIGTCVTAMLSSVGATKNGKRAALAHLYFNVIGVVVWLSAFYILDGLLDFAFVSMPINMWGVAGVHTVFKLLSVLLLAPFSKQLEKLSTISVRGDDKKGDEFTNVLDDRLLTSPSVAIERSREVALQMAHISFESLVQSIRLLDAYDEKGADEVRKIEDKVDIYEDVLGSYLVKLSARSMTEDDSHEVSKLLHMIGDFERISDHAVNIIESAEEMKDKEIAFSEDARKQLSMMYGAVGEILSITEEAFAHNDLKIASKVEPLEQVVDYLKGNIKHQHILRLQKSECTIEHGFVLSDILTNLERVSDHCSNIAGCIIEMSRHEALDLHEYLHEIKSGGKEYQIMYNQYLEKYSAAFKDDADT